MCAGAPVGPAPEHGEADPTIADPSLSAVGGPGIDTVSVARGPATARHPMGAGSGMDGLLAHVSKDNNKETAGITKVIVLLGRE